MGSRWILAVAGVIALLAAPGAAGAATFVVGSAADDGSGAGACATAADGCTLRTAVDRANALAGADSVSLGAGTVSLSATGAIAVLGTLTIAGAGSSATTINGTALDRVIDVVDPTAELSLSGLTLSGGNLTGGAAGDPVDRARIAPERRAGHRHDGGLGHRAGLDRRGHARIGRLGAARQPHDLAAHRPPPRRGRSPLADAQLASREHRRRHGRRAIGDRGRAGVRDGLRLARSRDAPGQHPRRRRRRAGTARRQRRVQRRVDRGLPVRPQRARRRRAGRDPRHSRGGRRDAHGDALAVRRQYRRCRRRRPRRGDRVRAGRRGRPVDERRRLVVHQQRRRRARRRRRRRDRLRRRARREPVDRREHLRLQPRRPGDRRGRRARRRGRRGLRHHAVGRELDVHPERCAGARELERRRWRAVAGRHRRDPDQRHRCR